MFGAAFTTVMVYQKGHYLKWKLGFAFIRIVTVKKYWFDLVSLGSYCVYTKETFAVDGINKCYEK